MCDCEIDEFSARLQAEADEDYLERREEGGRIQERAAIVEWLRRWSGVTDDPSLPTHLAECIEAGEHRKE